MKEKDDHIAHPGMVSKPEKTSNFRPIQQFAMDKGLRIEHHVFQVTLWRVRRNKVPTAPGCREKRHLADGTSVLCRIRGVRRLRPARESETGGSEPAWVSLSTEDSR
jgi:hypothetical protein